MKMSLLWAALRSQRPPDQLEEEEEDGSDARMAVEYPKHSTFQLCMQLSLMFASLLILFFGLTVTGVGLWAYQTQKEYLVITNDEPELTRLPFSMMVTGVFVATLGLIGVAGSIFSRTITGQTLLGVFSFVLVLVIISEVGAGVAAVTLRSNLEEVFENAALHSQMMYLIDVNTTGSTSEHWDSFQSEHCCCGAKGYVDDKPPYYDVFKNDSVPISCCNEELVMSLEECEVYVENATEYREFIYQVSCPSTVLEILTRNLTIVATIAILIGSIQLLAVLLAVVVAYTGSRMDVSNKDSYSYNKLFQQVDDNSQPSSS